MLSLDQEQDSRAKRIQICGCENTTQTHKNKNMTRTHNSDYLKVGYLGGRGAGACNSFTLYSSEYCLL